MRKEIKKMGSDSKGIIFNKEECKVYKIEEGKIFDIELVEVKK
jgi:ribosomal protein S8E